MREIVLIVDDEESVRRTFADWLAEAGGPEVLTAADAEEALILANAHPVDLAVLDWNLGSGTDGLRLLEDLVEFRPDIVAILVTGFANQATPLDALRMGVRDYLDKNQDLTRATFLTAVNRQLEKVRPAKRQRLLSESLASFRDAVARVVPLVQSASALNAPVPLPAAVHTLFRFLLKATGAGDGALIVRHYDESHDSTRCYAPDGEPIDVPTIPFSRTLAASVISQQELAWREAGDASMAGLVELYPFEANRNLLAAPVPVGVGTHVVLELFDKPAFTPEDRRLVLAAAQLGADLLKQALAERQGQGLLFGAVEAALSASDEVERALGREPDGVTPEPIQEAVMARLRAGLSRDPNALADGGTTLELAEAIRALAARHGPEPVRHCLGLVRELHRLLDHLTGAG